MGLWLFLQEAYIPIILSVHTSPLDTHHPSVHREQSYTIPHIQTQIVSTTTNPSQTRLRMTTKIAFWKRSTLYARTMLHSGSN